MKKLNFVLFVLFLALNSLLWVNCQKENALMNSPNSSAPSSLMQVDALAAAKISNVFFSGEGTHSLKDEENMTILGKKRTNPYTVDVMNAAFKAVYGTNGQLGVTDYYVKFSPKDGKDLKKLDAVTVNLYDYPLEYEVVKMGEFYQDPSVPADSPTPLYAVIKPDFKKVDVPMTIIANLHIPYDEAVIDMAFKMTGNSLDDGYAVRDPKGIKSTGVAPGAAGGGGGTVEPTNCTVKTAPCGCTASSEQRKPNGCISLVDDALPINTTLPNGQRGHVDGVRKVKVIMKDTWFTEDETWTTDNGCFSINARYKGKAWMWVRFKSDRCTIRGLRGARLWEYAFAVKDYVGTIGGPNFTNINVVYGHVTDDSDRGKLYWYAATGNNALHEFDDLANCDGINGPPQKLDVLITNYSGGAAAAPMLDKLKNNPLISLSVVAVIVNACGPLLGIPVVGPVAAGLCAALTTFAAVFAPDIVYNYGAETLRSDRVKDTFFHEYGHAAHYAGIKSNKDEVWLNNVLYIVRNGGYGTDGGQNINGANTTALIEAWGYHVGSTYTDRRYGINHTLTSSTDAAFRNQTRHIFALEQARPVSTTTTPGWIPKGVMHDLIDNNALNPTGVNDPINDRVTGYTTKQCFQAITTGAETPLSLRNRLNLSLPTGQSATNVNDIFRQYRWQ